MPVVLVQPLVHAAIQHAVLHGTRQRPAPTTAWSALFPSRCCCLGTCRYAAMLHASLLPQQLLWPHRRATKAMQRRCWRWRRAPTRHPICRARRPGPLSAPRFPRSCAALSRRLPAPPRPWPLARCVRHAGPPPIITTAPSHLAWAVLDQVDRVRFGCLHGSMSKVPSDSSLPWKKSHKTIWHSAPGNHL